MGTHIATTPFGRRPVSLGLISSQIAAREVPLDAEVSKWQVFRDIREAKEAIGATDRALAILNALLTFYREDDLKGGENLIVFPSNEQLIRRANGMSPATLRRHLAVLVNCGLVIRRDSPNGKRFARKGQGGTIEQAYGFDLSPVVARAQEFHALAAAAQAERKAYRLVRERLTICRRDIVKMIEAGFSEGAPGDWRGFRARYEAIVGRLPRTASREFLEAIAGELEVLWLDVQDTLESFVKKQESNANESRFEQHIQNSNTQDSSTDESSNEKSQGDRIAARQGGNVHDLPRRDLPLGLVLDACPEIVTLARGGAIRTWRDFVAAAELARPYMGISPSAWQEAVEAMGAENAAVTLAAILQRSGRIASSGGYLRNLAERARQGQFSVWPMVMALLRAKLDAHAVDAGACRSPENGGKDLSSPAAEIDVSDTLRKSIRNRRWES